jgi:hypothetical protein
LLFAIATLKEINISAACGSFEVAIKNIGSTIKTGSME